MKQSRSRPSYSTLSLPMAVLAMLLLASSSSPASSLRRSAVVKAVQNARPSVVNIHGQKVVSSGDRYAADSTKRVNGMGTGVVIDGRGFVLTNFHVVDGVRRIRVTLADGRAYIARLVAHDPGTDLAVIKIPVNFRMPVIQVGSSRDLMTGETVIAVGNAYGYEHTVTTGIVSAQHRNVQVNDSQEYRDLIQTDASINPGNSGGPLLNVDGEMIGINVAVRVGAQGIGFAIPIDRAMQVAARLLTPERLTGTWLGVIPEDVTRGDQQIVVVRNVESGSPADRAGVQAGDVIRTVGGQQVIRSLDVHRALLDTRSGDSVDMAVERGEQPVEVRLAMAQHPSQKGTLGDDRTVAIADDEPSDSDGGPRTSAWDTLGIEIEPLDSETMKLHSDRFRGGLKITRLDEGGLAASHGIRTGDILVGIHIWETISTDNLLYILTKADLPAEHSQVPFYVVRSRQTLSGSLPVRW